MEGMKNSKEIQQAARMIAAGELVAFPTETVYGLGANVFDPVAVARIFETKERPSFDPLIVHICELSQLDGLYRGNDERVFKLAEKFWPGPLTMVLPKKDAVPDIVTAGMDTVAVRMPANPLARELIRQAQTPIAAPSANKFGRISPTEAQHVKKQFPDVYTIDGGKTQVGIESAVITLHDDGFEVLRPGVITEADLEAVVSRSGIDSKEKQQQSPGLLKSHYSPGKPMSIVADPCNHFKEQDRAGLISFGLPGDDCHFAKTEVLSRSKDLMEAAVNLFSAMHRLDESDIDYIVAEPLPEEGIGVAIMNRLKKASY